jgi:hypothetical protein
VSAATETFKACRKWNTRAGLAATAIVLASMVGSGTTAVAQTPDHTVSLIGTWGSKVQFGDDPEYVSCYTFAPDGTITENAFSLEGRPLGSGKGKVSAHNGRMTIIWSSGSVEKATIRVIGTDRIRYTITSHTGDPRQVGTVLDFHRIRLTAPPEEYLTVEEIRTALDGVKRSLRVAEEALASPIHYTDKMHWSNVKYGCELRIQDLNELLMRVEGGEKLPRSELEHLRGTG